MAFGRLARPASPKPMGEINMTPLIDVMLVLLVIFMVAAPLMAAALRLNLPKTEGAQPLGPPAAHRVTLNAAGELRLDDLPLDAPALRTRLTEIGRQQPEAEIQLDADRGVPYGRVAELIGAMQAAGLSRIAFATQAASAPR